MLHAMVKFGGRGPTANMKRELMYPISMGNIPIMGILASH